MFASYLHTYINNNHITPINLETGCILSLLIITIIGILENNAIFCVGRVLEVWRQ